jgi:IS5 family transposase
MLTQMKQLGLTDARLIKRRKKQFLKQRLADRFLAEIDAELRSRGLLLKKGRVVDAALVLAPTSTGNQPHKRDPKRGPIWYMPFKKPAGGALAEWKQEINRCLSGLRSIGAFPFRVVKRQFKFTKVRYRGLFKNGQALSTKFALANLYMVRRGLLAPAG